MDPVETKNITLKVRSKAWSSMRFRTNRATQLRGLMLSYCDWNELVVDDVRFLCNGRQLCRDDTPQQVKMEEGDVIDAVPIMDQERPKKIVVAVKGLDGKESLFRINQAAQLGRLMRAYSDSTQLPLDQVRFVYHGRQLERHYTPQQLNMTDGDVIHAILRLSGS